MTDALPAVHDTGDGPALLLLHAFPLDSSQWDHQVAALSGGHRCLRPDFWGCAASPPPPDAEPSLDAFAASVLRALDDRGVDEFDLVGLSMGGYTAFALLRLAPQRVRSLVLANTRATADTDAIRAGRLELAGNVLRDQSVESLVEANVERLLGPGARAEVHVTDPLRGRIRRWTPAGVAYAARAMALRPDSSSMLASIAIPVMVMGGRDDSVIAATELHTLAGAIPHAQLVEMACGHLSNLEDPPLFTEHARRFLSRGAAVPA